MNTKIYYYLVSGLVLGVTLLFVFHNNFGNGKDTVVSTMATGAVTISGASIETGSSISSGTVDTGTQNNSLVYTNTEYGFQLTLPEGWEGYKVFVYKGSDKLLRGIAVALPTSMSGYKGVIDPNDSNNFSSLNTGSYTYIKGYAVMLDISILDNNTYETQNKRCKKYQEPGCFGDILGHNSLYYYIVVGPQTLTTDLDKKWGDRRYFDEIYKNFKIL